MKKLLTIVAAALILCLGLSVFVSARGETHSFCAEYNGNALRYENGIPVIDDINNKDWEKELLNKDNWKFVDNGQSPDLPGSDEVDSPSMTPKQNEQNEQNKQNEQNEQNEQNKQNEQNEQKDSGLRVQKVSFSDFTGRQSKKVKQNKDLRAIYLLKLRTTK